MCLLPHSPGETAGAQAAASHPVSASSASDQEAFTLHIPHCRTSPAVCFRGPVVSQVWSPGQAGPEGLGTKSGLYKSAHLPLCARTAPAVMCLHSHPARNGTAFRLYNRVFLHCRNNLGDCFKFVSILVQSAPSGPAHSAAERERSRGSVWLCQVALILLGALVFSSAEITGWHSETIQWEQKKFKKI